MGSLAPRSDEVEHALSDEGAESRDKPGESRDIRGPMISCSDVAARKSPLESPSKPLFDAEREE